MRAIVHDEYGPPEVLRFADVPTPSPGPQQVLVRVHATSVNRSDCGYRSGRPFIVRHFTGWRGPKRPILGTEFAGVVEQIGAEVDRFSVGQQVFGVSAFEYGAYAEYLCIAQDAPIAPMPEGLSFTEAAGACDGALLALNYVRAGGMGPGRRVLVYGASGSIGSAAVQLARHAGAHVTAVCGTATVELVRSLGADAVVDYQRADYTATDEPYDLVFDAVGKTSFRRCRRALRPGGLYLATELGFLAQNPLLALVAPLAKRLGRRRVGFPLPPYRQADVEWLRTVIDEGHFRPVIDRVVPWEQIVDATRYVETGQKVGNVVLTVTAS